LIHFYKRRKVDFDKMADEFDVDAMLEAPYKVKADDGEVSPGLWKLILQGKKIRGHLVL